MFTIFWNAYKEHMIDKAIKEMNTAYLALSMYSQYLYISLNNDDIENSKKWLNKISKISAKLSGAVRILLWFL